MVIRNRIRSVPLICLLAVLPIVGCKSAGNGQSSAKEIIGKDDRPAWCV